MQRWGSEVREVREVVEQKTDCQITQNFVWCVNILIMIMIIIIFRGKRDWQAMRTWTALIHSLVSFKFGRYINIYISNIEFRCSEQLTALVSWSSPFSHLFTCSFKLDKLVTMFNLKLNWLFSYRLIFIWWESLEVDKTNNLSICTALKFVWLEKTYVNTYIFSNHISL